MDISNEMAEWEDIFYRAKEDWKEWNDNKVVVCGSCLMEVIFGLAQIAIAQAQGYVKCQCGATISLDEPEDAEYYEVKNLT